MHTEHVNHDPASKFLHTGFQLAGRPSAGAWVSYALGSDNRDLPNFVVMNSGVSQGVPQDAAIWGPGFLPSHHQGVEFRAATDPVLYVNNPHGIDRADRRAMLDALARARAAAIRRVARSRDPVAREPVRDGVPDAGVGARGGRHLRRARARARDVRPRREEARHVRSQLPDRAAARRARREVPDAVRDGLGSSSRDQAASCRSAAGRSTSRARRS